MTAPRQPPALRLTNASKTYGGVVALDAVDLEVARGEVHALLGQNGSGKSTLVKILAGYHGPDTGARLELWGEQVHLPISSAHEHGVAVIHQDLGLVEEMTVIENFGITSGYGTRALLPIRTRAERRLCRSLLDEVGLDVSIDAPVRDLGPAQRAGVALARARRVVREHGDRHLVILDEPTTYLSAYEAGRMLKLIRAVAEAGSSVVFVTHRLQEALDVADEITVLRDGRVADRFPGATADQSRIIRAMLGRDLDRFYPARRETELAERPLEVAGLSGEAVESVTFEAAEGEIVGLAGLVGSGHADVSYILSGARRATAGTALLDGENLLSLAPHERLARRVVLIPGNRQRDGLWLGARAWENITLSHLPSYLRRWGLQLSEERRQSRTLMEHLGVRPTEPDRMANEFSGGNQQKLVLAKWLYRSPRLLLLDEPTQGIDAGAKRDILDLIARLADEGTIVLIASGDDEQLANVCNRVLVFRAGSIVAELRDGEISETRITQEAQGVTPAGVAALPSISRKGQE